MTMFRKTLLAAAALALLPAPLSAGPEKVEFPTSYRLWQSFGVLDRYERKTVRFLYANPAAMAAETGKAIPNGAILVLVERKAKLGADGNPVRNAAANIESCFTCHKPWVDQDYTLIFGAFVNAGKK